MQETRAYDPSNIFARIIRGEIPAEKLYENAGAFVLKDIAPKAPVHLLAICKGPYATLDRLMEGGSVDEIADFFRAVAEAVKIGGVAEAGYRIVSNNGANGGQEVPHLHFHVLGGAELGKM
jgi:diadenosine tetraphosphate (Ap4A) HIT family hydrolase